MIVKFTSAISGTPVPIAVCALDIALVQPYRNSYFTKAKTEIIVRLPTGTSETTTLYVCEELEEAIKIWEKALYANERVTYEST